MMNYQGGEEPSSSPIYCFQNFISDYAMDPTTFAHDLVSSVCDSPFSSHHVAAVKSVNGVDSGLDPIMLSKTWNIGLETAKCTVQQTTRLGPRNTTNISLNCQYATNDWMIRYKNLDCVLFSDTMFASAIVGKSVRNFTCCQVFCSDFGLTIAYNMEFERDIHQAYKRLFKEVGVPRKIIADGARA